MAKENKTRYALLGVLNLQPASGYDIKKFCDQSIAHFWNENYSHIYPVLKQLETEGLVEKSTETTPGKPSRNVYRITATGKTELIKWLLERPEVPTARFEFLLKMFFSKDIPVAKTIERLEESLVFCRKVLEEYRAIEAKIPQRAECEAGWDAGRPYWLATVRYGIINMAGNIQWCEETIRDLQSMKQ